MNSFNTIKDMVFGLNLNDIPDTAQHQARRCLLDLVGVLIAGRTTPLSRIINDHAHRYFHSPDRNGTLLGDGRSASAPGIALAGGMTIDSIDAHDGMKNAKGHAGCGVFPALVALLETTGRPYDDADFLTALIMGYEISIRDALALHDSADDYHTSGAWVAVGIAAMAARVRGQTENQLFEGMGIAEYHGPRSQMMRTIDHPTMVKDGSGWGAMAGVSAALLAEDGFTGAPAVTVTDPALAPFWSNLGQEWHIVNQYIKPWPVCRWAQPAVTATMMVMHNNKINHETIEKITVHSFHQAVRLATAIPRNTEEAQYSLPWPVAAAAVRGQLAVAEISEPFDDERIMELAQSMELLEDDSHNAAFPGERIGRVSITTKSGEVFQSDDMRATWDPEAPPSDDEMIEKYHQLADPVIGQERATRIRAMIAAIGEDGGQNGGRHSVKGGMAQQLITELGKPFL